MLKIALKIHVIFKKGFKSFSKIFSTIVSKTNFSMMIMIKEFEIFDMTMH